MATFAGPYVNRALLFPMQEVFEDFVTAAVRRHQRRFTVRAQNVCKAAGSAHSKPSSTRPIPGKSAVSRSPASAG